MKDIVFDLGGVMIDWEPRHLYRKIFTSAEEMEWFLTQVFTPQWNMQQDAGRPFAEATALLKKQYPDYAPQIDAYFTRWNEMLGGEIKGTVALWQELKNKGYRLYALTNWSAETFPIAQSKYEFFRQMDGIVVSGKEKLVKPDPVIYTRLLERFNLRASNCVFIDDNPANVAAAAHLGFDGIRFENPVQLRMELAKRELL